MTTRHKSTKLKLAMSKALAISTLIIFLIIIGFTVGMRVYGKIPLPWLIIYEEGDSKSMYFDNSTLLSSPVICEGKKQILTCREIKKIKKNLTEAFEDEDSVAKDKGVSK